MQIYAHEASYDGIAPVLDWGAYPSFFSSCPQEWDGLGSSQKNFVHGSLVLTTTIDRLNGLANLILPLFLLFSSFPFRAWFGGIANEATFRFNFSVNNFRIDR